jgi:hypothetical protein
VWIGSIYPVNLLFLTWAESLIGIQAPDTLEQSLPSQYFKKSGITPGETIRRVKERRICIGDFNASVEKRIRYSPCAADSLAAFMK